MNTMTMDRIDDISKITNENLSSKVWFWNGTFQQKKVFENSEVIPLYILLRACVVRKGKGMWSELKSEYFDQGYLVCGLTRRQIHKMTGFSYKKIQRNINKMVELRWIRIDKRDVGQPQPQHIYLLGQKDSGSNEVYYIDQFLDV